MWTQEAKEPRPSWGRVSTVEWLVWERGRDGVKEELGHQNLRKPRHYTKHYLLDTSVDGR